MGYGYDFSSIDIGVLDLVLSGKYNAFGCNEAFK